MQRKRIQYISSVGVLHWASASRVNESGRISKIKLAHASKNINTTDPFLRRSARRNPLTLHDVSDIPASTSMARPNAVSIVIDLLDESDDTAETPTCIDLTASSPERDTSRPKTQTSGKHDTSKIDRQKAATKASSRAGSLSRETNGSMSRASKQPSHAPPGASYKVGSQSAVRSQPSNQTPAASSQTASSGGKHNPGLSSLTSRRPPTSMAGNKRPLDSDQPDSDSDFPAKKVKYQHGTRRHASSRLGSHATPSGSSTSSVSRVVGAVDFTVDFSDSEGARTRVKPAGVTTNKIHPGQTTRSPSSGTRGRPSRVPSSKALLEGARSDNHKAFSENLAEAKHKTSPLKSKPFNTASGALEGSNAPIRDSPARKSDQQSSNDLGLEVPESPIGSPAKSPAGDDTTRPASLSPGQIGTKSRHQQVLRGKASAEALQPTVARSDIHGKAVSSNGERRYPMSPSETSVEDGARPSQSSDKSKGKGKAPVVQSFSNESQQNQPSTPRRQRLSEEGANTLKSNKKTPQSSKRVEKSSNMTAEILAPSLSGSPMLGRARSHDHWHRDGGVTPTGQNQKEMDTFRTESTERQSRNAHTQSPRSSRQQPAKFGSLVPSTSQEQPSRTTSPGEPAGLVSRDSPRTPHRGKSWDRDGSSSMLGTKAGASASKSPRLPRRSSPVNIEKVIGKYVSELRSDNEHFVRTLLRAARHAAPSQAKDRDVPTSVFKKMHPLKPEKQSVGAAQTGKNKTVRPGVFSVENVSSGGSKPKTHWSVPHQGFEVDGQDVPNYSHYVSIKDNFLASNEETLQHWPYFHDDFVIDHNEGLNEQYWCDVHQRQQKLERMAKAETYAEYCSGMLRDIGIDWTDVLRFLLDPSPDVGMKADAQRSLQNREELCKEEFSRASEPWKTVLHELPTPDPKRVGKAGVFCDLFQTMAGLSLWHVARRSDYTKGVIAKIKGEESLDTDELTCRTCMRFNCPYHGEMMETKDGADLSPPSKDLDEFNAATDIINPPDVNHRIRVGFPPSVDDREAVDPKCKTLKHWQSNANMLHNKPESRGPFYPCHHPGVSCTTAHCSCFEERVPCEKTCACSTSCSRKFQGCNCAKTKGKKTRVCFEREDCACFQLGRECDPDLCGDCGVCEVLDPANRHDDSVLDNCCRNASIQRGVPKHTLLGDSQVHGLGLYAGEDIREYDFVAEYKGEIVTKNEAERRGAIYKQLKLSYLFSLNRDQEIDSTYFGNKVRFINHALDRKANLYARTIMCNTVYRIALYGARHIAPGTELFFDYGPLFPDEELSGAASGKPHVRNSLLVRQFHDVEEVEEGGIKRARKSGKLKSAGSAKPPARSARRGHEKRFKGSGDDMEVDAGDHDDAGNGDICNDRNVSDYRPEGGAGSGDDDYEDEDEDEDEGPQTEPLRRGRGRPRKG